MSASKQVLENIKLLLCSVISGKISSGAIEVTLHDESTIVVEVRRK